MTDGGIKDADLTVFQRKLKEHAAKKQTALDARTAIVMPTQEHDADLVPEKPFEQSDADAMMDKAIDSIDILDAYARWCGKMKPVLRGNQRESIMISCPIPGHTDKVPSAWINLDKQTWFCGGCDIGGDAHDIAAYHFGYSVPAYKDGTKFHELRRDMAKDFGYTVVKLAGGGTFIEAPVIEEESTARLTPPLAPGKKADLKTGLVAVPEPVTEPDAEIINILEDEEEDTPVLGLNWRSIIPEDTFISKYMNVTVVDDIPEEYHFWNSMLALGFALGRDVRLYEGKPVFGNLFICTIGHTGSGKSQAAYHLGVLLNEALPHDWNDSFSKGVRKVSSPGSAEAMIHNFQKPVSDPSDPKKILFNAPVRGLIEFSELSALMGKASRMGNVSIPVLQQFYDMDNSVSTSSMTHGIKEAYMPFASALTTTQPKALKTLLSKNDADSGFLNRWIFAPGVDKKRVAIGGELIDMGPVVPSLQAVQAWAASFDRTEYMHWSEEASIKFTEFFDKIIYPEKLRGREPLIQRTDLLMKKIVLLFTANRMMKTVPIESVNEAILCWPYIMSAYGLISEEIGNTLQDEIKRAVKLYAIRQFKKDGKGISLRELSRAMHRKKYQTDQLKKACDELAWVGELKEEVTQTGTLGRPTVRYRYVS